METSAKANINVENVCSCSHSKCNLFNSSLCHQCKNVFHFWFTGIFDTRQRHQIKNGHKVGTKNSLKIKLSTWQCEKLFKSCCWTVWVATEPTALHDSSVTCLSLLQEGNTPQGSSHGVKISEPQKKTSFFRCSLLWGPRPSILAASWLDINGLCSLLALPPPSSS